MEYAFGVLKKAYGFTRFLLRGRVKVAIEMLLLCFAYNVNKLHHKIQGNRLDTISTSKTQDKPQDRRKVFRMPEALFPMPRKSKATRRPIP